MEGLDCRTADLGRGVVGRGGPTGDVSRLAPLERPPWCQHMS
jgi:hypothetical protein